MCVACSSATSGSGGQRQLEPALANLLFQCVVEGVDAGDVITRGEPYKAPAIAAMLRQPDAAILGAEIQRHAADLGHFGQHPLIAEGNGLAVQAVFAGDAELVLEKRPQPIDCTRYWQRAAVNLGTEGIEFAQTFVALERQAVGDVLAQARS